MFQEFRYGGMAVAIAMATLLVGAATGSAYLMFGLSAAALIGMLALERRRIGVRAVAAILAAAITATGIAFAAQVGRGG